jgi:large subunit ribosomal protein L14
MYVQTLVRICDNSGGFYALCIQVLGHSNPAKAGDAVMLAIKSIIINRKLVRRRKRKVLKGTVRKAVVIRTGAIHRRWGNVFLKIDSNAAAILGNWGMPLVNRIYGPALFELKNSKFPKFAMISEGVI